MNALNTGGSVSKTGFVFGVDPSKLSTELRRLADAIDAHEVLVQRVHTIQMAKLDEWGGTRVVLQIVEKPPGSGIEKFLVGSEGVLHTERGQ